MDTRMNEKLQDKLCEELEKVSRKGSMSAGDLDAIYKLVVSIEKLMKVDEMGGYSEARYSREDRGSSYRNSYGYDNGNSEARRGSHYVRGHYSRDDGSEMVKEHMREMMSEQNMSSADRDVLERAMRLM